METRLQKDSETLCYEMEKPESCSTSLHRRRDQTETQNKELNEKGYCVDESTQETPLQVSGDGSSSSGYDAFGHEDVDAFPDGGWEAWSVVFGTVFGLMTVFGVMDTMSSIQLYISKHQLADMKISSVSWIFSLYMFTNLSMGIVVGPIFDIYGVRGILIVGSVLNCGGLYATAFSKELWQFVLSFGICTGIGSGLMLSPLVGVVSHWFLRKRGRANGVSECGCISGVFFPIMLRSLYPSIGFTKSIVILASICVFLCILTILMVKDRSDVLHADSADLNKKQRLLDAYKHMVNFQNFKEKRYLFLVLGMFFNEFSIILTVTYIATYATARGLSESTGYLIVTVMNASGILGKIIPTFMCDFLGRFNVMLMIACMMVISLFAIWLPYYNIVGYYMFAGVYGFAFGAAYALTPVLIAQISKTREFGSRYATAYFIVSFGNLISMPIGSQFINKESVSNYNHMIIFAACSMVVATFFFFVSRSCIVGLKLKCFV